MFFKHHIYESLRRPRPTLGVIVIVLITLVVVVPSSKALEFHEPCGPSASYATHGVYNDSQGDHLIPDLPVYVIGVQRNQMRHRVEYVTGLRFLYPRLNEPVGVEPRDERFVVEDQYDGIAPTAHGSFGGFFPDVGIRISRSHQQVLHAEWTEERRFEYDYDGDLSTRDRETATSVCSRAVDRKVARR